MKKILNCEMDLSKAESLNGENNWEWMRKAFEKFVNILQKKIIKLIKEWKKWMKALQKLLCDTPHKKIMKNFNVK